jgi:hypothetical protein
MALYVEGDLSASDLQRVEKHLRECAGCWDLAEDLRESQALFKTMREEAPDDGAVFALRERVLADVDGLQPMTWFGRLLFGQTGRRAALASIALIVAAGSAMWLMRVPATSDPPATSESIADRHPVISPPQEVAEPLNAAPTPPVAPRKPERQPARRVPVSASTPVETKQVAIKFVTDDPDIIIYWLVDEKGD